MKIESEMIMDKQKQKYPVTFERQEALTDPLKGLCEMTREQTYSETNDLQVREYKAAIGLILEFRETLLMGNDTTERTDQSAIMAVASGQKTAQKENVNRGAFTAPRLAENSGLKFDGEDFRSRFSRLTKRLNQQLTGLKETFLINRQVTEQLSGLNDSLKTETEKIVTRLDKIKIDPEPGS